MSTQERYTAQLDEIECTIRSELDTIFSWECEREQMRLHTQSWQLSQFMHGEPFDALRT